MATDLKDLRERRGKIVAEMRALLDAAEADAVISYQRNRPSTISYSRNKSVLGNRSAARSGNRN
jgi:hypothetical protein